VKRALGESKGDVGVRIVVTVVSKIVSFRLYHPFRFHHVPVVTNFLQGVEPRFALSFSHHLSVPRIVLVTVLLPCSQDARQLGCNKSDKCKEVECGDEKDCIA